MNFNGRIIFIFPIKIAKESVAYENINKNDKDISIKFETVKPRFCFF